MNVNKFFPKPLPKYFFQNIIQLENAVLIEPNFFDIKSLCILYQRALEFYSFNQNILMVNAYQKKLKDLTENENIIAIATKSPNDTLYIEKKPDYEDLRNRVKQRLKNEKTKSSLLRKESNDIINEFNNCLISALDIINDDLCKQNNYLKIQIKLKKNVIKKQCLLASVENIANDLIEKKKSSDMLSQRIHHKKRKSTYNPSINNNALIKTMFIEKRKENKFNKKNKNAIEELFGTNLLDKINYLCQGMYDKKLNELILVLENMNDEKLIIALDHIEAMKEIDLMSQDTKEESEKLLIQKMKETMENETHKKNKELMIKFTKELEYKKLIISNEEISKNKEINNITNIIFDNAIKAITI